MDLRRLQIGIGEDAHEALAVISKLPRFNQFIIFGEHLGGGVGHALLQEQVRGSERGARQEAPLHGTVQKPIRQGEQAHALMMGHERADGDAGLVEGADVKEYNPPPRKTRKPPRVLRRRVVRGCRRLPGAPPSAPSPWHKEQSPGPPPGPASNQGPAHQRRGIGNSDGRRSGCSLIRTHPTERRAIGRT